VTDSTTPTDRPDISEQLSGPPGPQAARGLSLSRAALARLRRSGRFGKVAALIAASAIIGGAYLAGAPPADNHSAAAFAALTPERAAVQAVPAASAAAEVAAPVDGTTGGSFAGAGGDSKTQAGTDSQANAAIAADTTQIVKTGQMTLEVTAIDSALAQAQTVITGMGGLVDQSNRSGTGDETVASMTFRFPVAKWDAHAPGSPQDRFEGPVRADRLDGRDLTGDRPQGQNRQPQDHRGRPAGDHGPGHGDPRRDRRGDAVE